MFQRPGLSDWIEGSAFADRHGKPVVLYHGTDTGSDFNIFARTEEGSIGFHFGDLAAAHKRIDNMTHGDDAGAWGAVIPVYCNARRPLRLMDHHTWDIANVCGELFDLGIVNADQHDLIVNGYNEYALFAAIEMAGYDCVVYTNETEHAGTPYDSVIVWRAETVKGAYAGSFDRDDPGLVPSIDHDPDDFECWETVKEEIDDYKEKLGALLMRPAATATRGF
ncbi:hypothetical protein [Rhizobium sp. BK176]|uniref:ADP-ribosyltransferase-containing protein n=1 Tax=Rhizobium sp. BK176 TaxID=2587071 RepID=UPI002169D07B|nr:hypothetical protein [Rhizobium sp. BK176]MCS4090004.1 hypothetical protein [Rhizobium sp. BK176]